MSDGPHGTGFREHLLFVGRFLRSPTTVGAVAPSSRTMARMMVAGLPADRPVTVVELGPGTGPFTNAIVERVVRESRILAIDLEQLFVDRLRIRWPSVDCVCGSAADLERLVTERHLAPVDHIISGLPFASLPVDMTGRILTGIERTLRPGGTFSTFQYVHGYRMRPARLFRQRMSERMGGPPERRLVVRNLPGRVHPDVDAANRRVSARAAAAAPSAAIVSGAGGWARIASSASAQRPASRSSWEMNRLRTNLGMSRVSTAYSRKSPRDV